VREDASLLRAESATLGQLSTQGRSRAAAKRTHLHQSDRTGSRDRIASRSALPRLSGSRPRTNEYLYDGIGVLQPEPGQVAFFPIVDAIREFNVQTNDSSPPSAGLMGCHQSDDEVRQQ